MNNLLLLRYLRRDSKLLFFNIGTIIFDHHQGYLITYCVPGFYEQSLHNIIKL